MTLPARILAVAFITSLQACAGGADARQDSAQLAPDSTDARVRQADLARIDGDSAATVWLIMVSDFQCPYCKTWHDSIGPKVHADFVESGKVRFAYLNYPLGQHQHAVPAAEAAMCAGAQGKFWVFHDSLFASQHEWAPLNDPRPVFERIARATAVDSAAYAACISDGIMRPMIAADHQRGSAQGVRGTPTLFVGSRRVDNALSYPAFKPILDSAVAAARRGSG
jgi:protein-disulfide isomerase